MQEVFFMYRVIKVLNNNGILVLDDASGQELILLGNGAGFGHRAGERMTELPKGRRYELVSEKTPALIRVNGIDPIYIEAAGKIIETAEAAMGPLQHDILIPMADHIAMAAARAREKKEIPNPFQHDIAALFGDEYEAARKGCEILKKMTGTALGEDEAGFIALHIHAGLAQENVADSLETARLVGVCMTMIEEGAGKKLPYGSLGYNRLMSHVRYMLARARKGERTDLDLEAYAKEQFPFEYALAEQILKKLEQELRMTFEKEETGFLAIHIRRVTGGETA